MKPYTERKIFRWIHIIFSIPIVYLIYGPVSDNPYAFPITRWVVFPIIVLSGLWMWQKPFIRKWVKNNFRNKS